MSRRRTKFIAAGVAGLIVVAGTVVFALLRGEEQEPEQQSFCWGTLSRRDVSALSVQPLERYASEERRLNDAGLSYCQVWGGSGSAAAMREEFTLDINNMPPETSVWRTADEVAAESLFRAPIAGVAGWVNRRYAGVLLPSGCAGALGKGAAPYLQIKAVNDQEERWQDGTLQKRMTEVLMKAAATLTKQLGCSDRAFAAPEDAPRLLEPRALTPGKACGLPGFTPLRTTGTTFQEYVTPGDFRLWSCSIGLEGDTHGTVNFTVTQDPRLIGLSSVRSESLSHPGEALVTCGGKPTLLQMGTPGSTAEKEPGAEALRPDKERFEGFTGAVTRAAGCS
ncbi:hypothetical protein ACFWOJ_07410 [Streptomyces sp. NPDC058439]|uniref:hypothetical protein n=1 Tax=Streptomyces sp. NPDC058439 TaxID=3346500 RepID=UPI003661E75F